MRKIRFERPMALLLKNFSWVSMASEMTSEDLRKGEGRKEGRKGGKGERGDEIAKPSLIVITAGWSTPADDDRWLCGCHVLLFDFFQHHHHR